MNGPDWGRKEYEGPRRGRIKLSKYSKHQDGAHTIINTILKETFKLISLNVEYNGYQMALHTTGKNTKEFSKKKKT